MKILLISVLGAIIAMSGITGAAVAADKQKVVYHINYYDAVKQKGALRNVQNHINAMGAENLDLKIVMHGNGISLLMEPDALGSNKMKEGNADANMQARIAGLKDQGVPEVARYG